MDNYYYSPLTNGVRNDIEERKELQYGSVDFIASADYMNRPPMNPTYLFVFDVSKSAVDTGYLSIVTASILKAIENETLPGGDRVYVGFLTFSLTNSSHRTFEKKTYHTMFKLGFSYSYFVSFVHID